MWNLNSSNLSSSSSNSLPLFSLSGIPLYPLSTINTTIASGGFSFSTINTPLPEFEGYIYVYPLPIRYKVLNVEFNSINCTNCFSLARLASNTYLVTNDKLVVCSSNSSGTLNFSVEAGYYSQEVTATYTSIDITSDEFSSIDSVKILDSDVTTLGMAVSFNSSAKTLIISGSSVSNYITTREAILVTANISTTNYSAIYNCKIFNYEDYDFTAIDSITYNSTTYLKTYNRASISTDSLYYSKYYKKAICVS